MGPQGMWALLPGSVWGRGGAGGHQVCKGELQLLGGNRFLGRSRSAPDLFVFSHIRICVFLSHFVQFIFVDVNALV